MLSRLFFTGAALLFFAVGAWSQDSADDAFRLARNLYRDTRDYATAAELFAQFIRNYPDGEHLAEARLLLAHSYRRSQRCDLAIKAYEQFYQEPRFRPGPLTRQRSIGGLHGRKTGRGFYVYEDNKKIVPPAPG